MRAVARAADQRNSETSVSSPNRFDRARHFRCDRETTRTGRSRCRSSSPAQAPARISRFFRAARRRMLFEYHRFKIVTRPAPAPPDVPRMRLETKYFILLRFGCQTGAQVAIGLGGVDMESGRDAAARARAGASGSGKSSVPRPIAGGACRPAGRTARRCPVAGRARSSVSARRSRGRRDRAAPAARPRRPTIRRPGPRPSGCASRAASRPGR